MILEIEPMPILKRVYMSNEIQNELHTKCSGCGICGGICPREAISMKECKGFLRPFIDVSKCISCKKCVMVCPNNKDQKIFSDYSEFSFIGYGHSNNEILRKEAASGGIVSELLKYLLKSDLVDYVITSDVYKYNRPVGYVIIDKGNVDEIISYSGSNYCPVDIGTVIKDISNRNGKCAIVGLPCFARGIREVTLSDINLRKKIMYVFSLLCNHVPSYAATEYLIKKYRISTKISKIKYRGDGWFGYFRTYSRAGIKSPDNAIPFSEYYSTYFSKLFWQEVCVNCCDHFGTNADICFGDADFMKYRFGGESNIGDTIWFTNNRQIIEILKQMENEGIISFNTDISKEELEYIYGPICDVNRASKQNTRDDYKRVEFERVITYWRNRFKSLFSLGNDSDTSR